jgi:hypothetical protein
MFFENFFTFDLFIKNENPDLSSKKNWIYRFSAIQKLKIQIFQKYDARPGQYLT